MAEEAALKSLPHTGHTWVGSEVEVLATSQAACFLCTLAIQCCSAPAEVLLCCEGQSQARVSQEVTHCWGKALLRPPLNTCRHSLPYSNCFGKCSLGTCITCPACLTWAFSRSVHMLGMLAFVRTSISGTMVPSLSRCTSCHLRSFVSGPTVHAFLDPLCDEPAVVDSLFWKTTLGLFTGDSCNNYYEWLFICQETTRSTSVIQGVWGVGLCVIDGWLGQFMLRRFSGSTDRGWQECLVESG